jgi:hypothetical protein
LSIETRAGPRVSTINKSSPQRVSSISRPSFKRAPEFKKSFSKPNIPNRINPRPESRGNRYSPDLAKVLAVARLRKGLDRPLSGKLNQLPNRPATQSPGREAIGAFLRNSTIYKINPNIQTGDRQVRPGDLPGFIKAPKPEIRPHATSLVRVEPSAISAQPKRDQQFRIKVVDLDKGETRFVPGRITPITPASLDRIPNATQFRALPQSSAERRTASISTVITPTKTNEATKAFIFPTTQKTVEMTANQMTPQLEAVRLSTLFQRPEQAKNQPAIIPNTVSEAVRVIAKSPEQVSKIVNAETLAKPDSKPLEKTLTAALMPQITETPQAIPMHLIEQANSQTLLDRIKDSPKRVKELIVQYQISKKPETLRQLRT